MKTWYESAPQAKKTTNLLTKHHINYHQIHNFSNALINHQTPVYVNPHLGHLLNYDFSINPYSISRYSHVFDHDQFRKYN